MEYDKSLMNMYFGDSIEKLNSIKAYQIFLDDIYEKVSSCGKQYQFQVACISYLLQCYADLLERETGQMDFV